MSPGHNQQQPLQPEQQAPKGLVHRLGNFVLRHHDEVGIPISERDNAEAMVDAVSTDFFGYGTTPGKLENAVDAFRNSEQGPSAAEVIDEGGEKAVNALDSYAILQTDHRVDKASEARKREATESDAVRQMDELFRATPSELDLVRLRTIVTNSSPHKPLIQLAYARAALNYFRAHNVTNEQAYEIIDLLTRPQSDLRQKRDILAQALSIACDMARQRPGQPQTPADTAPPQLPTQTAQQATSNPRPQALQAAQQPARPNQPHQAPQQPSAAALERERRREEAEDLVRSTHNTRRRTLAEWQMHSIVEVNRQRDPAEQLSVVQHSLMLNLNEARVLAGLAPLPVNAPLADIQREIEIYQAYVDDDPTRSGHFRDFYGQPGQPRPYDNYAAIWWVTHLQDAAPEARHGVTVTPLAEEEFEVSESETDLDGERPSQPVAEDPSAVDRQDKAWSNRLATLMLPLDVINEERKKRHFGQELTEELLQAFVPLNQARYSAGMEPLDVITESLESLENEVGAYRYYLQQTGNLGTGQADYDGFYADDGKGMNYSERMGRYLRALRQQAQAAGQTDQTAEPALEVMPGAATEPTIQLQPNATDHPTYPTGLPADQPAALPQIPASAEPLPAGRDGDKPGLAATALASEVPLPDVTEELKKQYIGDPNALQAAKVLQPLLSALDAYVRRLVPSTDIWAVRRHSDSLDLQLPNGSHIQIARNTQTTNNFTVTVRVPGHTAQTFRLDQNGRQLPADQ